MSALLDVICKACGQRHAVYLPEADRFSEGVTYCYSCPRTGGEEEFRTIEPGISAYFCPTRFGDRQRNQFRRIARTRIAMNQTLAALVEARKSGVAAEVTIEADANVALVRASFGNKWKYSRIAVAVLEAGDADALLAELVRQTAARCR